MQRSLILLPGSLGFLFFGGCAHWQTRQMETELQQVAKRWSLTIRASQVIPVYPLTEDLQPGDIFLVQTPIPDQVREYRQKGFLPLNMHVYRLDGLDYTAFYQDGYFRGDYGNGLPHARPTRGAVDQADGRFTLTPIPAAQFPDYTFESKRGMKTRLAVPVNAVPVGIGLLGTNHVSGSIKIRDAFSYGVSDISLLEQLDEWATRPDIQVALSRMRSQTDQRLFLRVVSRVYLVGGVTVSLQAEGSAGGGLDIGAATLSDSPAEENAETTDATFVASKQAEKLKALSEALNEGLPGGSLRIASANRGSVVMDETFERLLAIGYLGFDVEVDRHGRLSAPVATQDLLAKRQGAAERLGAGLSTAGRDVVERHVRDIFERILADPENTGPVIREIRNQLDAFGNTIQVPQDLPAIEGAREGPVVTGDIRTNVGEQSGFARYAKYRRELNNSLRALDMELTDRDLLATRDRLVGASAELKQRFETSPHVALALRIYYEEVLMNTR